MTETEAERKRCADIADRVLRDAKNFQRLNNDLASYQEGFGDAAELIRARILKGE